MLDSSGTITIVMEVNLRVWECDYIYVPKFDKTFFTCTWYTEDGMEHVTDFFCGQMDEMSDLAGFMINAIRRSKW